MSFDRRCSDVAKGRLAWISLAGIAALALAIGLTLALTRFQALAQPAGSASVESPTEPTAVVTSQIHSPNMDAYVTKKVSLTVSGIAWPEGADPPYLTDFPRLSLQRLDDRNYYVKWTSVVSAENYLLQEATDPAFGVDDITLSQWIADTSHPVSKLTDEGTYYYRVRAAAPDVDNPSRWSNVESVSVPWSEGATSASSPAALGADGSITVEVRIDDGAWQTAAVTETSWGAEWVYVWEPLPEERNVQHVIESRAAMDGGSFGAVDAITITLDNEYFLVRFPMVFRRWPPTPVLNPIPAPSASRSYVVSWQGVEQSVDHYTLQQARTSNFSTVDRSWDTLQTSQQIQNAYCAYYYRVRADNAGEWGEGPWSNVQRGQASPPDPPVLNNITDPNKDNVYAVSWSPVSVGVSGVAVDRYILQESKDPTFATITNQWPTQNTSVNVENEAFDTFYYRVRADDLDCWGHGPWSGAKSITTVWSYFDNFSDVNSGWPSLVDDERWAFYEVDSNPPDPGDGSPYPSGGNGYFIARRSGGEPLATFGPGVVVPSNRYQIEVDTRWWDSRWGATYQILFGANASLSNYYAVRVKIDDVIDLCRFSLVKQTGSTTAVLSGGWMDTEVINCGQRRDDSSTPWNHWKIRRDGSRIRVHVNGTFLGEWSDSSFGANRYFGVRCTLYEGFTPSKPEYDNFSVELLD